jgi:xanthine dehydrogenase YagS FAD-binding subunit
VNAFEFASPATIDDALKALAGKDGAVVMGGGTDLIDRMKDHVASPSRVVYLRDIKDLAGVELSRSGLVLGAGTRLADIASDKNIAEQYPAIAYSAREVGTPQIRNMATLGGNLLQRPRDWYFRNGFGLPATKDGKNLLREGDNRYASIFMTDGEALYHSPSSLAIPLIALGAKAKLVGPNGDREVAVEDLYRVPKKDGDRELAVEPGEILTRVIVPVASGKNASYGVRWKQAHDWPLVSASCALEMDGEKVKSARVVLYGVAPIPWRSKAAEDAIAGRAVSMETAAAAGEAAVKGAKPLSMNGYKIPLTRAVVKRVLLSAAGNEYWKEA